MPCATRLPLRLTENELIAVDTVLRVQDEKAFIDLAEGAGVLATVKDKARYRARACGPP
jgi:hypothetical protein